MQFSIPKEILNVHTALTDANYETYFVGGCVRDLLRKKEPKDWDITTNATPKQIQNIFPDSFYENNFGTVGVVYDSDDETRKIEGGGFIVEVTTYRRETKYSDSRRPDSIAFCDSLEDDLDRRDFTMNAIAYDPKNNVVVDPHGGKDDIKRKVITTVGNPKERFAEDALRMLRAVRLSAELDFTIAPETAEAIAEHSSQLEKISKERIRDEFVRIVQSHAPMPALFQAQKLGLLKYIAPGLEEGIGIDQNQAHSFGVFEHSLRTLQHAADKNFPLEVRLAALLHDIGKPASRRWSDEKKDWTFYGHEVIGARMTKKITKELRFSKDVSETVYKLVRWHMFFADPDKITLSAVRRVIRHVGEDQIWNLLHLRECDRIGTGRPKAQPFRLRKYTSMVEEALRDPISVTQLKINGARIMEVANEKPGPRLGWILHALLEEVLDDPKKNTKKYLEKRAQELIALPEKELRALGEQGKERRESADEAEIERLRKKYHVQ